MTVHLIGKHLRDQLVGFDDGRSRVHSHLLVDIQRALGNRAQRVQVSSFNPT